MPELKTLTIKITEQLNSTLDELAAKKHSTKSDLVRRLIEASLEQEQARESIDFVREQIHEEFNAYCGPQFERLAKLEAKIGYQSVSTFYLLAYIMDKILPPSKAQTFDEVKRLSKAMAISYLQFTDKEAEHIIRSEDAALEKCKLG